MFRENRRYDHVYDPVFIQTSGNRAFYRGDKTVTQSKILGTERCKFFAQSNKQFANHTTNVFLDAEYLKSPTSTHLPSPNSTANPHSRSTKLSASMDLYRKNFKSSSPHSSHSRTQSHTATMQKSQSRDSLIGNWNDSGMDGFTKTIGIQTDYRDSCIQTDPYSPDFEIIKDDDGNDNAPLLQTMHLKFTNGTLPAGYDEIEQLEREVIKKQIIAALPNKNDKKSLALRRKILSKIEASDWEYKEMLMKREQHERYLNVINEMKKRDEMIEKLEEERINKLRMDLYAKQQIFDEKMESKRIKALRKISNKHNKIQNVMNNISRSSFNNGDNKHEDTKNIGTMIDKYYNYNSELYAPIKREGNANSNNSTNNLLQTINNSTSMGVDNPIHTLSITQAIEKLDIGIQNDINTLKQQIPTPQHNQQIDKTDSNTMTEEVSLATQQISESIKLETKKYSTRAGQKIMQQLDHMNDLMKATYDEDIGGNETGQVSKRFENIYKTFNPVNRPATPQLDDSMYNIKKMEDNNDITLLQSLIRGRAVQNQMYQGKEQRLQLIQELQIKQHQKTESIVNDENEETNKFKELAPIVMQEIENVIN